MSAADHWLNTAPSPAGVSTCQRVFPVFLSSATRKARSPGPKFKNTRSPESTGEDP